WSLVTDNTISTVTQSTYQRHGGTYSLFFNNPTDQEQLQIKSDKIAVVPGGTYTAKAWVYVMEQSHSLGYEFHYWTADNTKASTASTFKNFAKGTIPLEEWTEIETNFTVPEDAAQVELRFNSGKAATSTIAYIDDVSIVTVSLPEPEDPEGPLDPGEPAASIPFTNQGFEADVVDGVIPGWSLKATTAGEISISTSVRRSGSKSLHFKDV